MRRARLWLETANGQKIALAVGDLAEVCPTGLCIADEDPGAYQ
jgi:hypothetical protein